MKAAFLASAALLATICGARADTFSIPDTPTVQNAAYSQNNAIGGLRTIRLPAPSNTTYSGFFLAASVEAQDGATTGIALYLFDSNPTATTCTDKSAFSLGAADVSKLITPAFTVTPAAQQGSTQTGASSAFSPPVGFRNADSPRLGVFYVCAVVAAGVTPGSTTNYVMKYQVNLDGSN